MPDEADLADVMRRIGMHHIELVHERRTVGFRIPDIEINLGSIGKGYALDRMAELFAAERIENFLLHGGNSSLLAQGTSDSEGQTSRGWSVGLRHPLRPEQRIGEIRLHNRSGHFGQRRTVFCSRWPPLWPHSRPAHGPPRRKHAVDNCDSTDRGGSRCAGHRLLCSGNRGGNRLLPQASGHFGRCDVAGKRLRPSRYRAHGVGAKAKSIFTRTIRS